MTTDFRALCAELVDIITAHANPDDYAVGYVAGVLTRARAALADEPAAGEPASVTGQPSDEELALIYHDCCRGCEFMDQGGFENAARAVLARWGNPAPREPASVNGQPSDEDLWNTADLVFQANSWPTDAIRYARAVLARWGNPAPQPPAKGEVAELVAWLRGQDGGIGRRAIYSRIADLLHRLSPPQPVPVSERLPGPEDCDAEGRCWWLHVGEDGVGDWFQRAPYPSVTSYAFFRMTHWLPAHALPLPEVK